jgi:transposase
LVCIDDFAWRRGHSYGRIVVDLERRQVIDLLPDRQRDTVTAWLRQNPQVEIICGDRGPGYGVAASEAAPQARQVADRWHLFENASAAFLAAVRSEMPCLRRALAPTGLADPATLTRAERIQWDGEQLREALNRQIIDLAAQGIPIKAMARATGVSRQTIRKVLRGQRHDTFRSREFARRLVADTRGLVERGVPDRRGTLASPEGIRFCRLPAGCQRMGHAPRSR